MHVMDEAEYHRFLTEGTRTGKLATTRADGRYMGAERVEEYGRRNAVPGELLVRITPNHVVAQADIAD
jgi:hypothetical protein